MRHFLCRLNPPRPTFAQDMSPEEQRLMAEHGAYWKGQLDLGKVIVFGPVADPKGAWGMAVLQVEDATEADTLTASDPVVTSGRGFSYDILPMLRAITRG